MQFIHVVGGIRDYLILISQGVSLKIILSTLTLTRSKKTTLGTEHPLITDNQSLSPGYNRVHSVDKFNYARFTVKEGLKNF